MNNSLKTVLLLGLLSGVLLALGEFLGGAQGLIFGFGFAVVMNFVSYWWSDKIVLKMYRAQEVGPEHRLWKVVRRLATQAGLPMPKVYVIPDPAANAFATGRNPEHAAVAATEGPGFNADVVSLPSPVSRSTSVGASPVARDSGKTRVASDSLNSADVLTSVTPSTRQNFTVSSV